MLGQEVAVMRVVAVKVRAGVKVDRVAAAVVVVVVRVVMMVVRVVMWLQ